MKTNATIAGLVLAAALAAPACFEEDFVTVHGVAGEFAQYTPTTVHPAVGVQPSSLLFSADTDYGFRIIDVQETKIVRDDNGGIELVRDALSPGMRFEMYDISLQDLEGADGDQLQVPANRILICTDYYLCNDWTL
ncbi:MAG TPA: hypothetical protein VJC21_04225 [Candidatus Nanoarchaeia archaeon]|nr:hypothetical protein [Candidatus Nanoarchaeia archaeon]